MYLLADRGTDLVLRAALGLGQGLRNPILTFLGAEWLIFMLARPAPLTQHPFFYPLSSSGIPPKKSP